MRYVPAEGPALVLAPPGFPVSQARVIVRSHVASGSCRRGFQGRAILLNVPRYPASPIGQKTSRDGENHAAHRGGGVGGPFAERPSRARKSGKAAKGTSTTGGAAGGAANASGMISLRNFEEAISGGIPGFPGSGCSFFAAWILRQSEQGFSPLNVSTAPRRRP